MIKVVKLTQTCLACPSQWEGETDKGKSVYVRYRWGNLRVEIDGKTVFNQTHGDYFDGIMTFDQLKEHTKGVIKWNKCQVV